MPSEEEEDMKRIKEAAASLGEHFDTVQIFVTRHDADSIGSVNATYGSGNWFARLGLVRDWLIRQDEFTRLRCRTEERYE
jgi:hypothetical protein